MAYSKEWREQLHRALTDAFPSRPALEQMVHYGLDWRLDEICPGRSLRDDTFELVKHASAHNKLADLLRAARGRNPDNPALLDVESRLPDEAALDPEPAVRALKPREEVRIVFANYNPKETPAEGLTFRIHADFAERPRWEERFGTGFTRIRQALVTRSDTRALSVWLACTPAVAVRAGAVVHHSAPEFTITASGVKGDSLRGPLDVPPDVDADLDATHEIAARGELHVLLSVTQDVTPGYNAWVRAGAAPAGAKLAMRPRGGPSQSSIRDTRHALAWAVEVRRQILEARDEAAARGFDLPVTRIFYAGPAALAFAIGRRLNAMKALVLMDYDRGADSYVESFKFVA